MLSYDSLYNWYKTNFNLMQHHKYNLHDIENMMPWERHLYIEMLKNYLETEAEKAREAAAKRQNAMNAAQRKPQLAKQHR